MKQTIEVAMRLEKIGLLQRLRSRQLHRDLGFYRGQLPVLDYVRRNPRCTQVEVARKLQVTPATIAISTRRMEKAGLLVKSVDQDNLRCNRLAITERGEGMVKAAFKALQNEHSAMLKGFTEEELELFLGFADRVLENQRQTLGEQVDLDLPTLMSLLKQSEKGAKNE